MLELRDVTVAYNGRTVLERLSVCFDDEPTVIVGPSGSGKSTLLRVAAGLLRPDTGSAVLDGQPVVSGRWVSARDPRIALIYQDYRLVAFLNIADNIRLACEAQGRRCPTSDVVRVLGEVGLTSSNPDDIVRDKLLERMPHTLSGGEQQRVAIARCLITERPVVLADEPTGALDRENTIRVMQVLRDCVAAVGGTLVVASHDQTVIDMFDRQILLVDGRAAERDRAGAPRPTVE